MVSGYPISNRSQTYFWKDFYCPELSTCSTNLNSGVFGKLIFENTIFFLKILFGQIIFVRTYYIALYTWHDHWEKVLDQVDEL